MTRRLRVGAVEYLNTKPLVEGLSDFAPSIDLVFDLPSGLADQLARGELDVGLIPVVEYFRAGNYSMIPSIGIVSRGPVLSVTLFSRVPWPEITSVGLDEGSRTSAALVKILLAERTGQLPQVTTLPMAIDLESLTHFPADAVLLIGDRAMRACLPGYPFAYDLGEEWTNETELPFVYAVWAIRSGVELGETETAFVKAKELGMARAGQIAAREAPRLGLDPGYCRRYLTNIIRYDIGPRERAGLERFHQLAVEIGAVPKELPCPISIASSRKPLTASA